MSKHNASGLTHTAILLTSLCLPLLSHAVEPDVAGWSLQMDNDALALSESDQDYSFGFGLVLAGDLARSQWLSLDPILEHIEQWVGWPDQARQPLHSIQFGLMAFTPDDLETERPLPGRTPYANLTFISNARERVYPAQQYVDYSSLSVGLLGTPAGEHLQRAIHYLTDDTKPRGWDNQISDGGELTFRYVMARQQLRRRGSLGGQGYEIKRSLRGSLGFFTEGNMAYSLRYGRLRSPWWQHAPDNVDYLPGADYSGKAAPSTGPGDFFVFAGVMLRLRAYNALLQGQFRDSAVTYDQDELRHALLETWLGITREFKSGLRLDFTLRYKSREIRDHRRASAPVWGSVSLSHGF